jgi:hypothetical protein
VKSWIFLRSGSGRSKSKQSVYSRLLRIFDIAFTNFLTSATIVA